MGIIIRKLQFILMPKGTLWKQQLQGPIKLVVNTED